MKHPMFCGSKKKYKALGWRYFWLKIDQNKQNQQKKIHIAINLKDL